MEPMRVCRSTAWMLVMLALAGLLVWAGVARVTAVHKERGLTSQASQ